MRSKIIGTILLPFMSVSASAHVVLAEPNALPGSRYVAHFRLEHGCSGSPTTIFQVEMPLGVSAVAPETPPGWSLATVRAGGRITLVTWKDGIIPADKQGEFTVAMTLPATLGILIFPATQTCENGVVQWMDPPAPPGMPRPKNPAAALTISSTPPNPPAQSAMPGMPAGTKM
jgi:periplasmic copper chaperone A